MILWISKYCVLYIVKYEYTVSFKFNKKYKKHHKKIFGGDDTMVDYKE